MFYPTISAFFEAEGDFEENLEPEEDPCCLLYKEHYDEDHEYDCPRAVLARERRADRAANNYDAEAYGR